MPKSDLAAPELANVEVDGMTRSAFIIRGALTAGAVYGTSVVGPFVGQAFAQSKSGGGGDLDILNFALTLEYLESAFYSMAMKQVKGLGSKEKQLVQLFGSQEDQHVMALTNTIKQMGGKPAQKPGVNFGNAFKSRKSFLKTAQTFEDLGVGAYNGAGPQIQSKDVLAAAGSIVQIEGRHAAVIRFVNGNQPAPFAFDPLIKKQAVLKAVKPFVK